MSAISQVGVGNEGIVVTPGNFLRDVADWPEWIASHGATRALVFAVLSGRPLQQHCVELESLDLERELVAAYRRYHPCQCRWVNWRLLDEAQVQRAASIIPASHLLAIKDV